MRFSFVFDNLFCGYEVRHKEIFRLRNLRLNKNKVEVLRISSDGDDSKDFLGLKFSIPGVFGVGKLGKYYLGRLDISKDSWWCSRISAA